MPWRSVFENVRIAAPDSRGEEIDLLLSQFGLAEHATHYPEELSLGLARRVALARALAAKPDLLLLDEPLVSLDATLARDLREKIATMIEEKQITTLIVTHDLSEAVGLADRVFLLSPRPGRIVTTLEIATPRQRLSPEAAGMLEAQAREALSATRPQNG